jgi:hypothetical protein
MNKHEEAIALVDWVFNNSEIENNKLRPLINYITSCEATENELSTCKIERSLNEKMYEGLKRDVKRYFYLLSIYFNKATNDEVKEYAQLKDKLSKVGDSNETTL